jgi:hypothetical protein
MADKYVVVGAKRTPFGKYLGALSEMDPQDLAVHAGRAALTAQGRDIAPEIDQVFVGNCIPGAFETGSVTGRQIGLKLGIDKFTVTLDTACCSPLTALRMAVLAGDAELPLKEFARREAQLYQKHYDQVVAVVDEYAREHGLSVVLRADGGAPKSGVPGDVLRNLSRPVVWTTKDLDITSQIIQRLVERVSAGPAAAGKATKPEAKEPKKPSPPKDGKKPGPAKPKEEKPGKKPTVLRIVLRGEYPEGPAASGLLQVDDLDLGAGKAAGLKAGESERAGLARGL